MPAQDRSGPAGERKISSRIGKRQGRFSKTASRSGLSAPLWTLNENRAEDIEIMADCLIDASIYIPVHIATFFTCLY